MTLEWNNGSVGQFSFRGSAPTFPIYGHPRIPAWPSPVLPAQQRFQVPNRMGPGPSPGPVNPTFVQVQVFMNNRLMAEGTVSRLNLSRARSYITPFQGGWAKIPSYYYDFMGSPARLDVTQAQLPEVLRILGLAMNYISPGSQQAQMMSGPLQWNSSLGSPIQLIKGNRYQSRWLVEIPPPSVNQPQQTCDDVLTNVQKALFSASYAQGWPWESLGAYGAFSQIPAGWPSDMRTFPFEHPGACLVFLDGVWGAPTTTVDSANLPTIPGAKAMDFRNGTTGQTLVEEPRPSGPCAPADLTFDIVNGIFKCAGQILQPTIPIPAIPVPPLPTIPAIPAPPPVINPTQPTVTITPTGKKKEKASVLPWVIGGGVILIGGSLLLAR